MELQAALSSRVLPAPVEPALPLLLTELTASKARAVKLVPARPDFLASIRAAAAVRPLPLPFPDVVALLSLRAGARHSTPPTASPVARRSHSPLPVAIKKQDITVTLKPPPPDRVADRSAPQLDLKEVRRQTDTHRTLSRPPKHACIVTAASNSCCVPACLPGAVGQACSAGGAAAAEPVQEGGPGDPRRQPDEADALALDPRAFIAAVVMALQPSWVHVYCDDVKTICVCVCVAAADLRVPTRVDGALPT